MSQYSTAFSKWYLKSFLESVKLIIKRFSFWMKSKGIPLQIAYFSRFLQICSWSAKLWFWCRCSSSACICISNSLASFICFSFTACMSWLWWLSFEQLHYRWVFFLCCEGMCAWLSWKNKLFCRLWRLVNCWNIDFKVTQTFHWFWFNSLSYPILHANISDSFIFV